MGEALVGTMNFNDAPRAITTVDQLSRMFDHCEVNHSHHPGIAEFWNTVTSLSFVLVGVLGLRALRGQYFETRYKALNIFMICSGLAGAFAHGTLHGLLIKLDHIVFTLSLSLFAWLIDGDDYLLIFWQIHGLFSMYVTAAYHWFYPIHMNIMLVAIFWFLFKKLERFPEAPDAMLVFNSAVVSGLMGTTLLASDHLVCGTGIALPHMRAIGQVFVAISCQHGLAVHLFLRSLQQKQPCEIVMDLMVFPRVQKVSKDHNA